MKFLLAAAMAVIAIVFIPGNVLAQSNDVILRRLDVLEKENTALRDRVRRLEARKTAALPAAPAPARRHVSPVDWSGIHVGVFSGYALGQWSGTAPDYPHQPVNGPLGGIAIGYDCLRIGWSVWRPISRRRTSSRPTIISMRRSPYGFITLLRCAVAWASRGIVTWSI